MTVFSDVLHVVTHFTYQNTDFNLQYAASFTQMHFLITNITCILTSY